MKQKLLIETFVKLLIEREIRQANLTNDRISEWGSEDHVGDLSDRIEDATYWRDKYQKGTEKRAHYRNVLNHLKNEMKSALRRNKQINEKQKQ
jgi:hypothetical protein